MTRNVLAEMRTHATHTLEPQERQMDALCYMLGRSYQHPRPLHELVPSPYFIMTIWGREDYSALQQLNESAKYHDESVTSVAMFMPLWGGELWNTDQLLIDYPDVIHVCPADVTAFLHMKNTWMFWKPTTFSIKHGEVVQSGRSPSDVYVHLKHEEAMQIEYERITSQK